jgi:hypothetical protein
MGFCTGVEELAVAGAEESILLFQIAEGCDLFYTYLHLDSPTRGDIVSVSMSF